jgi:hypothetical protein
VQRHDAAADLVPVGRAAGRHGGQDDQRRGEGGAFLEVRRRSDHPAQALSVGGAEGVDLGFPYRPREFGAGLGQEAGQQGTGAAVEALGQQDRAHRTAADWQNAERD